MRLYLRYFLVPLIFTTGCVKFKKSGEDSKPAVPPTVTVAPVSTSVTTEDVSPSDQRAEKIEFFQSEIMTEQRLLDLGAQVKKIRGQDTYVIEARQIIFKDQVEIKLENLNVQFATDKLIIEGGANLTSFRSSDKAPMDEAGRSGGRIYIRAKSADGVLNFYLSGENGGDGSAGPAPGPELNGQAGANGDYGMVDLVDGRSEGTQIRIETCMHTPTLGNKGTSGRQGYSGRTGGNGGHTSELILKVNDSQNFNYKIVEQSAGRGGMGGSGGAGGKAGARGAPGPIYVGEYFKEFHTANPSFEVLTIICKYRELPQPDPIDGPQGNPGQNGQPGEVKQNTLN